MVRRRAVASWSAAVPSAAFGLLSDVGWKAPEKTGALQKLRQYRGMGVPRASVMECGCSFCPLCPLRVRSSQSFYGQHYPRSLCASLLVSAVSALESFLNSSFPHPLYSFKMVLPVRTTLPHTPI